MGTFWDVKTEADRQLLKDYDAAVLQFREEVSLAMDMAAIREPSIARPMHAAAEAMRARPLPSEVNESEEALMRVGVSTFVIEMAFGKLQSYADSEKALNTGLAVVAQMREIAGHTTNTPEFRPVTAAVLNAVSERKAEILRAMNDAVFDTHLAALKKPLPQPPAAPGKNAPKP